MDTLGQATVTLNVRPARAAYFVESGHVAQLRQAIETASCHWGGVNEPIIPVATDGRLSAFSRRLLEIQKPEFHVHFGLDSSVVENLQRRLGQPFRPRGDGTASDWGCHPLAALQSKMTRSLAMTALVNWDRLSLVAAAGLGILTDDDARNWQAAGAKLLSGTQAWSVTQAQFDSTAPIQATGIGAEATRMYGPRIGPSILWVARPNSFADAIEFWNCRALAPNGAFASPTYVLTDTLWPTLAWSRHALHQRMLTRSRSEPDLALVSKSLSRTALERIREDLDLESFSAAEWSYELGPGDEDKALSAVVGVDPKKWLLWDRDYGPRQSHLVQLFRPSTTLRLASPLDVVGPRVGHVMAELSGLRQFDVPRVPSVATEFHRMARWSGDGLKIWTRVIPEYDFQINIPEPRQVLAAFMSGHAAGFKLSDKGQLAEAVADLFGDLNLLTQPFVLDVIRTLTTPRRKHLLDQLRKASKGSLGQRSLEALASEWGRSARQVDRTTDQILSSINVSPRESTGAILEALASVSVVTRGLRLSCPRCSIDSLVHLEDVRGKARCPACGALARYVAGHLGEPRIHYRLNALVDRASDNGVLSHLVAHARLLELDPDMFVLLGTDVRWSSGSTQEVDLLGYSGQQVLAGEVKTKAAEFTPSQIRRDVSLTKRLGASVHVMACNQPIPRDVVAHAEGATERARLELRVVDPRTDQSAAPSTER